MKSIKIGQKAIFDISHYDERHILKSDIENPPDFDKIKKVKEVFKNKKHDKALKAYTILLARSDELRGDTKISNERLADLLELSVRQTIRCLKFLEKHRLIAVIKKTSKFGSKFKTIRIIRVWLTYYKNLCRPIYDNIFKNDIRPGKIRDAEISRKIPLKYKIWKGFVPKTPCKITKKLVYLEAVDYSWFNLYQKGYINEDMHIIISQLTEISSDNDMRKNVYKVMGYSKDFLVYKNTGIKRSDNYRANTTVKEELKIIKDNIDSWREDELISN